MCYFKLFRCFDCKITNKLMAVIPLSSIAKLMNTRLEFHRRRHFISAYYNRPLTHIRSHKAYKWKVEWVIFFKNCYEKRTIMIRVYSKIVNV